MRLISWLMYHLGIDQPDVYQIEYFRVRRQR
jgi:hypothetical protein